MFWLGRISGAVMAVNGYLIQHCDIYWYTVPFTDPSARPLLNYLSPSLRSGITTAGESIGRGQGSIAQGSLVQLARKYCFQIWSQYWPLDNTTGTDHWVCVHLLGSLDNRDPAFLVLSQGFNLKSRPTDVARAAEFLQHVASCSWNTCSVYSPGPTYRKYYSLLFYRLCKTHPSQSIWYQVYLFQVMKLKLSTWNPSLATCSLVSKVSIFTVIESYSTETGHQAQIVHAYQGAHPYPSKAFISMYQSKYLK